jgi:hypothetical protein
MIMLVRDSFDELKGRRTGTFSGHGCPNLRPRGGTKGGVLDK